MTDVKELESICADAAQAGRRAAGEDPAKREQILEGAKRVFMEQGFDAASMNDITRAAGVSKGTIYVYFQNKEDLFAELIERERTRISETAGHALDAGLSVEQALHDFGVIFCTHISSNYTINAMRIVIGAMSRMPALACSFLSSMRMNPVTVLKAYLDRQVSASTLAIDDTEMAARQFLELSTVGIFKPRLFGSMASPPPTDEIERIVNSAVRVFLAAYGAEKA
ncbi:TetR/AcrR family transcriptional regulator [Sinorhizobium sp. BG8]|uniref:TetR/AcrR family transcriptional regulator n=1 Tax=Sinorhizobium sp. BG8 TaxID=2613773 RepID=UPI00193D26A6|nr:TetR/AcrR family transcriptional regulator [Sinorhizobium sp. BG8]QRM53160.1 TetR/AcrR family transcriptional regulator [Sinorhizobium sp. BG8]